MGIGFDSIVFVDNSLVELEVVRAHEDYTVGIYPYGGAYPAD